MSLLTSAPALIISSAIVVAFWIGALVTWVIS
jgi:hypothetical protein